MDILPRVSWQKEKMRKKLLKQELKLKKKQPKRWTEQKYRAYANAPRQELIAERAKDDFAE